jgi:hypothetical protein
MSALRRILRASRWAAGGLGLAALGYATYVGIAWYRYGALAADTEEADRVLDGFMPEYDVAERHNVRVAAPAHITLAAAAEMDLEQSTVIRGIFNARALVLGAGPDDTVRPRALLSQMKSLGWGVLAELPGREVIMGAVTQPWLANVTFRALPPDEFKAFREPGYVKIAWTLRADAVGPTESNFVTETRVVTTDAAARARFRWYWARFSPGIVLIRQISLRLVKSEAEYRARTAGL